MQLPKALQNGIEKELAGCELAQLREASARLSQLYRGEQATDAGAGAGGSHLQSGGKRESVATSAPCVGKCGASNRAIATAADRAAYFAVRMPATFAAVSAALRWTQATCGDPALRSVLDLGSGPGTALWAAAQQFPSLELCTALERDAELIAVGRRLAAHSDQEAVRRTRWLQADLAACDDAALPSAAAAAELPAGSWDLVLCSYVLNELEESRRASLIREAWARCAKLLLVVEPGTRAGFANVLAVRNQVLAEPSAMLAAPCPHALACPMAVAGDWCHFAARVERTAVHRRIKDATLGHEDEKFSYVAFARVSASPPRARIVRHPTISSGYAQLTICSEGHLEQTTITRSQKEAWRRLKRAGWGDEW